LGGLVIEWIFYNQYSVSLKKQKKYAAVDLELKETRLAQIRKELLTVDAAVQVVEDVLDGMRTEGL